MNFLSTYNEHNRSDIVRLKNCLLSIFVGGVFFTNTVVAAECVANIGTIDPPQPEPVSGNCLNPPAPTSIVSNEESATFITVSSETELQQAMSNLTDNTVVLLAPGTYQLSNTLWVQNDNVTLRGNGETCDDVVLVGKGMDNLAGKDSVPHGVWTNALNLSVQNMTIQEVYYHGIAVNRGAQSPYIYNVRFLDTGEQMIKVSSPGSQPSTDNGIVDYSIFEYSEGPTKVDHGGGTGYTNGVDVHGGHDWVISNNRFENFHTDDSADNLWNPAILMWNGAANTIVEKNVFVDVDRAIAYGLVNRDNDHSGGIIRNNMIVMSKNLYSSSRKSASDAAIIVWDSPNTEILHNTILSQGNLNDAIQLRFDSTNIVIQNNLIDASIRHRDNIDFTNMDNLLQQDAEIFRDVSSGDLHLSYPAQGIVDTGVVLQKSLLDFDGHSRGTNGFSDIGADEYQ